MSKMCINCGQELSDQAKFCDECGASAEDAVLVEDNLVSSEPVCPKCNTPLKPNAKFCGKCGAKLESSNHVSTSKNEPENPLPNTSEQSESMYTAYSQPAASFSPNLPTVSPVPEQILQPGKHISKKAIQISLGIAATIIIAIITVICITMKNNPPGNAQMIADLQEHDFSEYFIYNFENAADIDYCTMLEYKITDLKIDKRDTKDDYDTAWFQFTADNAKNQYTGSGTILYKKYTKGGWIYDGHTIDTYESKPIKAPDADDVYESWNYDWAFMIADDAYSSVSVLDSQPAYADDYSYNTATVTVAYTGTLDGERMQLTGTFHVVMCYYPDNEYSSGEYVGWRCEDLDLRLTSDEVSIIHKSRSNS